MTITTLPPAPSTSSPSTFDALADAFIAALPTFVTEANALGAAADADATSAAASAATAVSSAAVALAAANYYGDWSSLTGAAAVPYSVSHQGKYWQLVSNIPNITLKTPGVDPEWLEIPTGSAMVTAESLFMRG